VDFVGSKQMQEVRGAIRGQGEILMGKNTIMRKVIRENMDKYPGMIELLPKIVGNMGFLFTNGDLNKLRKSVESFKMPASAKAGVLAPVDVIVPAGPTGLDPGQTSFFQTLNIGTKITKGTIEITNAVHICTKGVKVTTSAVALLSKLGIRPFEYGIEVPLVYENGSLYAAAVLDLDASALVGMACGAIARLSALSFNLGMVNISTIPHSFGRVFNQLAAIAIEIGYVNAEMKKVADVLSGKGSGPAPAAGGAAAAVAAAPEEEEEEEAAPAMDMFGGGGDEEAAGGDY
jgi:large subunit ribosomal protein LP0